jgi:hypothetical protein
LKKNKPAGGVGKSLDVREGRGGELAPEWRKAFAPDRLTQQLKAIWMPAVICVAVGLFGVLATFCLTGITGLPFSAHSRDMAAILVVKETLGFLSNLGIMLWSFTTAICVFSAILLKRFGENRRAVLFFLFAGLLTFWLTIDDLFLFHDRIFPDYLHLPERAVHGCYALITVVFIGGFFKEIMSTHYFLLILAGIFLGASMSMDVFFGFNIDIDEAENFFEDSLKFIGITFWLGYFSNAALLKIKHRFLQRC